MRTKNYNSRAFLYLLPALIFIGIFVIYPIFNAIYLSFLDNSGNFSLDSWSYVLGNSKFQKAILNTFLFAVFVTPSVLLISLVISFLLSQKIRFKNTFQTIFFLPYVTSTVAIGAVWSFMYHTDYGIFNQVIEVLGFEKIGWLSDPKFSMVSVIIFGIWKSLAFNILLLFTALASINSDLERAALIDGSSAIKTFIKIKLPQIYPVLGYLLMVQFIYSVKVFEEVVSLFEKTAGPDNAAITMVYYIQQNFVTDKSAAAVAALVLFMITFVITLINNMIRKRSQRRKFNA